MHSASKSLSFRPPRGYDSWVEFAVDTVSTREVEMERLYNDESFVPREEIRMAVWNEFNELRKRAGLPPIDPSTPRQ